MHPFGAGSRNGRPKNNFGTKGASPFGHILRAFRDFLSLVFSFSFDVTSDSELYALWWPKGTQKEVFGDPFRRDFEVTSDSELYALWCRKGAQKMVFGEAFRSDSEVSGESENEAPV